MKSAADLLALAGVTAAVSAASSQLGNLPRGVHTSHAYFIRDAAAARRNCDKNLHCAAISYRRDDATDDGEEEVTFHQHTFAPRLLTVRNATGDYADDSASWDTYISQKEFVFHPGRMVVDAQDVLQFEVSSDMSLVEAQEYCRQHEECVGFTFPTHSSNLRGFENITFARSLRSMEDGGGNDKWRTFVANDLRKSPRVSDASALPFVEQFDEQPFRSCCAKAPRDEGTNAPRDLPDIEEVRSVDALPRIPCNISQSDFQSLYERTRTPVMLVGCDNSWPAKERWTREALADRFANDTAWRSKNVLTSEYGHNSWGDILEDMGKGTHGLYIFDQLDRDAGKSIEEDYDTPAPFAGRDRYPADFPADYGSRRWWCVGPKGSGAMPHNDPYSTDAWNTVVHGHKWWVLYPPSVKSSDPVECDAGCSTENPSTLDWYMSVARNALRTAVEPNGVTPVHVLQSPGETIYVPYDWVHSVMNMDEHNVAITANYGAPGNLQIVWKEALDDGNERWFKSMYMTILDAEQRGEVREGEYWPPEDWLADEDDEEEEEKEENDDLASLDVASLEAEGAALHRTLKTYEKEFVIQHRRQVLSLDDILPVQSQYQRYEAVKKAIALKA